VATGKAESASVPTIPVFAVPMLLTKQGTKTIEVADTDVGSFNPQLGEANAVFLILCRNDEVDGAVRSIRELEDRFNRKYRLPQ
jgi:hypothetical protein